MMKKLLLLLGKMFSFFSVFVGKYKVIRKIIYRGYIEKRFYSLGEASYFGSNLVLHLPQYIKIGKRCNFGKLCVLTTWGGSEAKPKVPKLIIGDDCNFGEYNHLTAFKSIKIGNGVLTGRWVTISDNSHGETYLEHLKIPPAKRLIYSKGEIIIEDNVWIGDKATILAGVKIGEGSVIGANTVVTKDIPPYSVAVGNPVRIIKNI